MNMSICKRQEQQKKASIEQIDHYKSASLWASLVLPQQKYSKSDFFFSFEQKVRKFDVFWVTVGVLGFITSYLREHFQNQNLSSS